MSQIDEINKYSMPPKTIVLLMEIRANQLVATVLYLSLQLFPSVLSLSVEHDYDEVHHMTNMCCC
jgi:hypothetical protein